MFITRLISGIVLLAVAFLVCFFGGYPLACVLLLLSIGAFYELTKVLLSEKFKKNAMVNLGYVAIVFFYILLSVTDNKNFLVMAVIFSVIMFLCTYVFLFPKYTVEDVSAVIFSFMYAPVMLSFVYLTRGLTDGKLIVWMIFISSWGFDTCAYCVGMLTGKTIGNHKFLPKLSPKKSIEGVIGGIIGAGLIALLFGNIFMPEVKWYLSLIAAIGGIIAQIGDLAASAIKRNKGIKDYGKLIPGHGGVMDRFDSMIFTAPIIYFLAIIWVVAMQG